MLFVAIFSGVFNGRDFFRVWHIKGSFKYSL